MAHNGSFTGLYGDYKFIDAFYMYTKLKKPESSSEEEKRDCFNYFVKSLSRCLDQINDLRDGESKSSYLNWIRWYSDIITTELQNFKDDEDLKSLNLITDGLMQDVDKVLHNYFQLNEAEKSISNEYCHAFDRADREKNNLSVSSKVFLHAGRLLINYVKNLAEKRYMHSLDRADKCFEQLKSEAEFLASKLQYLDNEIAKDILTVVTQFENLRRQDEGLAKGHDIIMADALNHAHSRATENVLQTAIRHINETICLLKQAAYKKMNEAFKATAVLVKPLLNPKETWNNLVTAMKNPFETFSEIKSFAKNNPWKFGLYILGGLVIGAFAFGMPMLGVALATPRVISSILIAGAAIVTPAIVTPAILVTIAGVNVVAVKKTLDEEVIIHKAKVAALEAENEEEGRKIAEKVLFDHHLRQRLKEARENAERDFQKYQELEQQAREKRKMQIKSFNAAQCDEHESNLKEECQELENELMKVQSDLKKRFEKSQRAQLNVTKILEGMNASMQLIEEPAEKYKLPASWHRNYTTSQ